MVALLRPALPPNIIALTHHSYLLPYYSAPSNPLALHLRFLRKPSARTRQERAIPLLPPLGPPLPFAILLPLDAFPARCVRRLSDTMLHQYPSVPAPPPPPPPPKSYSRSSTEPYSYSVTLHGPPRAEGGLPASTSSHGHPHFDSDKQNDQGQASSTSLASGLNEARPPSPPRVPPPLPPRPKPVATQNSESTSTSQVSGEWAAEMRPRTQLGGCLTFCLSLAPPLSQPHQRFTTMAKHTV